MKDTMKHCDIIFQLQVSRGSYDFVWKQKGKKFEMQSYTGIRLYYSSSLALPPCATVLSCATRHTRSSVEAPISSKKAYLERK
jgi:hypothetical protein